MNGLKMIHCFQMEGIECTIYSDNGRLGADVTSGEDIIPYDADIRFEYDERSLSKEIEERWASGRLNIAREGNCLIFSEKEPDAPVAVFEELGISQPAQTQLAVVKPEAVAAESLQDYGEMLGNAKNSMLGALKYGGSMSVKLTRPKFVFNKEMQLQSVDKGGMKMNFTSQEMLVAQAKIREREKRAEANSRVKEEESKLMTTIQEHKEVTQSQLDAYKTVLESKFQVAEAEAKARLDKQALESQKIIEILKTELKRNEIERKCEVEMEISRRKAALQMQELEIEREEARIRDYVEKELAAGRRRVDMSEMNSKYEQKSLQTKLSMKREEFGQEMSSIENERREIAWRKAEEEKREREGQKRLKEEKERLEKLAREKEALRRKQAEEQERQWREEIEEENRRKKEAAARRTHELQAQRETEHLCSSNYAWQLAQAKVTYSTYTVPAKKQSSSCSLL